MCSGKTKGAFLYFPAVHCVECDCPIDALVSLCVPRDEAMALVIASWSSQTPGTVMATLDGGRAVVALRMPDGRWAGCNAFPDRAGSDRGEAQRQLKKLLRRGRRGYVGILAV